MVVVQVEVSAQWRRLMPDPDPASGKTQKSSEYHSPKEPRKGLLVWTPPQDFQGKPNGQRGNTVLVTGRVEEACEPGKLCKSKDGDKSWGLFLKFKEPD